MKSSRRESRPSAYTVGRTLNPFRSGESGRRRATNPDCRRRFSMLQIAQSPVAGQVLFADLSDDDAVEAIGESAVTAAADAAEAGGAAAFVDGDLPHATI